MGLSRIEWLAVVFMLALAMALVVYLSPSGEDAAARRAACVANLSRIGQAMASYLEASDDHWPAVAKLESLAVHDPPWPMLPEVLKPYLKGMGVFRCPADSRTLAPDSRLAQRFPRRTTYFDTEGTSYEWLFGENYAGKKVGTELMSRSEGFGLGAADQPILRDFDLFHTGDGGGPLNTLYADLNARSARGSSRP